MASGDSLIFLTPSANDAPASALATFDTRNGHQVLDFDATTDESAVFRAVMPQNYAGGGVTVYLHVAFSSATSNVGRFDVAFERIGDAQQDLDADGFATAKSVDITAPGTSGHVTIASISFSSGAEMDSVTVGESFRIKFTRDADHANDTATGDAELLMIELRET